MVLIVADRTESFEREIAPLQLPLVVLLEQERADEPDDRGSLGKMPTTSVRRLISALSLSSGLVEAICLRCARGKSMNASTSFSASSSMRRELRQLRAKVIGDDVPLLARACGRLLRDAVLIRASTICR